MRTPREWVEEFDRLAYQEGFDAMTDEQVTDFMAGFFALLESEVRTDEREGIARRLGAGSVSQREIEYQRELIARLQEQVEDLKREAFDQAARLDVACQRIAALESTLSVPRGQA